MKRLSADAAAHFPDGAADADLAKNTAVQRFDQPGVALTARQVRPGAQPKIIIAGGGGFAGYALDRAGNDPRRLVFGAGVMVKNAGLADKELFQRKERLHRKALAVAVYVVVAEHDREHIHLVRLHLAAGVAVDQAQLLLVRRTQPNG